MRKTQYSKIVLIVMIALMVPVLLYTVFQFIQRSEEEELVRSIYDRQLESLLFSVNQYCWDITQAMASELSSILAALRTPQIRLERHAAHRAIPPAAFAGRGRVHRRSHPRHGAGLAVHAARDRTHTTGRGISRKSVP